MVYRKQSKNKASVLFIVLIFMLISLIIIWILSKKISTSYKSYGNQRRKNLSYYLAAKGIELARIYLANNFISTSHWADLLSANGQYQEINYLSFTENNIKVHVYVKDNSDGDGDFGKDNDLKIYVLSRAIAPGNTEIMIETILNYNPLVNPYIQKQLNVARTGFSSVRGVTNWNTSTTFELGE